MMEFDLFASAIAGGVFLCFLLLFFWRIRTGKTEAHIRFSNVSQLKQAGSSWRANYRWTLKLLRVVALIFFLIAFARPRKGLETVRTAREGIAIQMVIDRSSSMSETLQYKSREMDRLSVVKEVFRDFVLGDKSELKGRRNDMIGLTSFAGFVEENAPLTLDHQSLANFVKTIGLASKIEDGTMIGDALYHSTLRMISVDELLKKAGQKENDYKVKSKIIILLTDGQQSRGGLNPIKAANTAKENGIKIYTIAITESEYKRRNSLLGGFFRMGSPPLDTSMLERVAKITGGMFAKASSGDSLLEIYKKIDKLEKSNFEERFTTYKEQFPFFLSIGLAILLFEILLSQTLFRKIP